MSEDERNLLVEMLETSRERVRAAIETVPEELWRRKPADGGWSAAECAEHLVLAEESFLDIIRNRVLASPTDPVFAVQLKGKDGVVVQAMQDCSVKHATFDFLMPKGAMADRRIAVDEFLRRRSGTLHYVRECSEPLHHHAQELGPLGLIDAYQWLLLIAVHSERHVPQIQSAAA